MNSLFDIAKANQESYLAAYQEGHHQGYMEGMRKAISIMEDAAKREAGMAQLVADLKADQEQS